MFTGIVEVVGVILAYRLPPSTGELQDQHEHIENSLELVIGLPLSATHFLDNLRLGDSIAVNGTCLTVTRSSQSESDSSTTSGWFEVGVSPETLRRTNLGDLIKGDSVNLERSLAANGRFDGHFVQGHVDATVRLLRKETEKESLWLYLELTSDLAPFLVPKGYVSLDGTSLTVCEVNDDKSYFSVMLVAYTQHHVILPQKKSGDRVNVEVDMMGKYIQRQLQLRLGPRDKNQLEQSVLLEGGRDMH